MDATDRCLAWFHSERYRGLEELTYLGWYFQIEIRRHLLDELTMLRNSGRPLPKLLVQQIDCVRQVPVVSLKSLRDHGLKLEDFHRLCMFYNLGIHEDVVAPLVFEDLIGYVDFFLEKFSRGVPVKIENSANMTAAQYAIKSVEEQMRQMYAARYALAEVVAPQTFREEFPYACMEVVELNLAAPDRLIISDFKRTLKQLRRAYPFQVGEMREPKLDWMPPRKREYNFHILRSWEPTKLVAGREIQFLDLIIWEFERRKIPPLVKAALLFPERSIGRKKRRSITSRPSRKGTPESKIVTNRVDIIEMNAFALMDPRNPARPELLRRAQNELRQAQETSAKNQTRASGPHPANSPMVSDFVLSESERAQLRRRLSQRVNNHA
jgi:hypothetical protein